MEIILCLVGTVVLGVIIFLIHQYYEVKRFQISFKEALDLCDLPVITLYQNGKRYNFLLDTGSNRSHISVEYIDELKIKYAKSSTQVSGIEGNSMEVKQGVSVFEYRGKELSDFFLISDLRKAFEHVKTTYGVQLHGILGTSFFTRYKYVIDFNKCICYYKKR